MAYSEVPVTRHSDSGDSERSNLWAEPALSWSFMESLALMNWFELWFAIYHWIWVFIPPRSGCSCSQAKASIEIIRIPSRSQWFNHARRANPQGSCRQRPSSKKHISDKICTWKTVRNETFSDLDSRDHRYIQATGKKKKKLTPSLSHSVGPFLTFPVCAVPIHNYMKIRFHWSSIKVDLRKMMIKGVFYPTRWASLRLVIRIMGKKIRSTFVRHRIYPKSEGIPTQVWWCVRVVCLPQSTCHP
jgi:hypothetical protein